MTKFWSKSEAIGDDSLNLTKKLLLFDRVGNIVEKIFSNVFLAWVINSLPNENILDWPKLKAFADDYLNIAKMMIFLYDGIENIVRERENADYRHFLLFPQYFQKASSTPSLKVRIVW